MVRLTLEEVKSYLGQFDYYLPEFSLLYFDLYVSIASDFEEDGFQDSLILEFICRNVAAGQAEIRSLRDFPHLYPGKTPHDLQVIQSIYDWVYDSQDLEDYEEDDDLLPEVGQVQPSPQESIQASSQCDIDVVEHLPAAEQNVENECTFPCQLDASAYAAMDHQFETLMHYSEYNNKSPEECIKLFKPINNNTCYKTSIKNFKRWKEVRSRLNEYFGLRQSVLSRMYVKFAHLRFIPPDLLSYPWQAGVLLYSKSPDSHPLGGGR